jgi:hypothetical protein
VARIVAISFSGIHDTVVVVVNAPPAEPPFDEHSWSSRHIDWMPNALRVPEKR